MKQDLSLDLFIDGAWQPAPAYTRDPVTITHGRDNPSSGVTSSSGHASIQNDTGTYQPRNPRSTLYGKLGLGTPLRVRLGASDIRFAGEIAATPARRSVDDKDRWIAATAYGVSQRLDTGAKPLRAAPYRYATTPGITGNEPATFPAGYWPLDEGTLTDLGTPAAGTDRQMTIRTGASTIKPGEGELGPWVPNGVQIGSNAAGTPYIEAAVATIGDQVNPTDVALDFLYADGVGVWSGLVYGNDGLLIWRMRFDSAAGEVSLRRRLAGESGAETTLATASTGAASDRRPHHARLELRESGVADTEYTLLIDGLVVLVGTDAGNPTPGVGRVRISGDTAAGAQVNIGHVAVWSSGGALQIPPSSTTAQAWLGWPGERAGRRIQRLCEEAGVTFTSTGNLDDTEPCGAQHTDTLPAILAEAADADLGILYDTLGAVGLHYRTRVSMYNQAAALTLSFAGEQVAPPLEPAGDNLTVRNDITVTRRDGASARAVLASGAMSTAEVGTYDQGVTVNVAGDTPMIENQAGWRLHLGTVDVDRFRALSVDLDAHPSLAATVAALRVGDRVDVVQLPEDLSADPLTLIVEGWSETIGSHRRTMTFNTSPELSLRVAVYESAPGPGVNKYDSDGSTLSAGVDGDDASLSVAIATARPLWTVDDAEFPFDIGIGGERITVTDITGGASPQTFTVTRSVNGVVKSHSAGAEVRLWQAPVYAL